MDGATTQVCSLQPFHIPLVMLNFAPCCLRWTPCHLQCSPHLDKSRYACVLLQSGSINVGDSLHLAAESCFDLLHFSFSGSALKIL